MNKNILTVLGLCILAILLFFAFYYWDASVAGVPVDFNGIVLYYSDSCPHCKNVEKWLTENNVAEKVNYTRKSVDKAANVNDFFAKGAACGFKEGDNKYGSIPLLYDGESGTCYLGEVEVVDFLEEKIK